MIDRAALLLVVTAGLVSVACGGQAANADRSAPPASRAATPAAAPAAAPAVDPAGDTPVIVFLGDSLTAGLGLDPSQSFPSLIQARLRASGYPHQVVNAGVSGDTSAGGLRRLAWSLGHPHVKVLVVALGGNDGLRGLPPEQLAANLGAIIEQARERGVTVVLAGMEAPPNFGADYTARFREVYPALARTHQVPLIPFLLDGVAGDPAFNQSDGIHPNPRGAERVADLVWRTLEPQLTRPPSTPAR